jgi:hypothetical protein
LESSSPPPELRDDLIKDCITEVTHKTVEGPHSTDEESEQESREQEKRGKSRPFPKEIQVNSERRKKADGNKDKGRGSVQNEDEVLENRSDRKDMNEDMGAQDEDDNDEDLDQLLVKAQHSLKRKAMFKEQANEPRFNFPKLETGLDTKNVYIRQQGTKAKIDMNTVVVVEKGNTGPKQKQQSTTLETCEINMNAHKVHVSKKQKQEVRDLSMLTDKSKHESQHNLRCTLNVVLGTGKDYRKGLVRPSTADHDTGAEARPSDIETS